MWIENLPEIGGSLLERGREIEANKARLRAELDSWLKAEANLWCDVVKSGLWNKSDTSKALVALDPQAVAFLPRQTPRVENFPQALTRLVRGQP
jgi:hypothetical protein